MSKTGKCTYCSHSITIPNAQCLFTCRNCNNKAVFLCHVLPEPKDPMHIRCKECKCMYSMYNCPKCQGFSVIKGFKSGKMYNCLCGFQATMLSCNQCTALLCLPNRKNYEFTLIKCKKCQNQFKYQVCSSCGECNYFKPTQSRSDVARCFNEQCAKSKKQSVKYDYKDRSYELQAEKSGNPYQLSSGPQRRQSQLCNICLHKQKSMINTACYHLSVCQGCSKDLGGRCPICRAVGEYKMIYHS